MLEINGVTLCQTHRVCGIARGSNMFGSIWQSMAFAVYLPPRSLQNSHRYVVKPEVTTQHPLGVDRSIGVRGSLRVGERGDTIHVHLDMRNATGRCGDRNTSAVTEQYVQVSAG